MNCWRGQSGANNMVSLEEQSDENLARLKTEFTEISQQSNGSRTAVRSGRFQSGQPR